MTSTYPSQVVEVLALGLRTLDLPHTALEQRKPEKTCDLPRGCEHVGLLRDKMGTGPHRLCPSAFHTCRLKHRVEAARTGYRVQGSSGSQSHPEIDDFLGKNCRTIVSYES